MRTGSNVAQWGADPSESTEPRNALTPTFHCADEMKAAESSSPAQGWEHWEHKPCQDNTPVNVHSWQQGEAGAVLIQRGTPFWPPTCLSQWADCWGSHLKSIIEIQGSSFGSEKWWMKSLFIHTHLKFHITWGNFCPIVIFQEKKSVLACAMLFLFKHLNILKKGEWRIKLSLLPREEWWFRDRMVFCWESNSSGDHTPPTCPTC